MEKPLKQTIIPLYSESAPYREWEMLIDGEQYCVVDDDGAWTLLQLCGPRTQNDWREVSTGIDVETFLTQHQLVLSKE